MRACRGVDNQGEYEKLEVIGERVDALVPEDVVLMKLDVAGFEPLAFRSAQGIMDSHTCAPLSCACMLDAQCRPLRIPLGPSKMCLSICCWPEGQQQQVQ